LVYDRNTTRRHNPEDLEFITCWLALPTVELSLSRVVSVLLIGSDSDTRPNEVIRNAFLTSFNLDRREWLVIGTFGRSIRRSRGLWSHCIGGWVDPRAVLHAVLSVTRTRTQAIRSFSWQVL
jgi:hypothetical protein